MFKKMRAYPNGQIEYVYGDVVVIEDKHGVSHIRPTIFDKEKNERYTNIHYNRPEYRTNQLYNDL